MSKNEIKKALYKENPIADLLSVNKDGIHYEASILDGLVIYFTVPFNDIGEAIFYTEMEAKYLIRYLNDIE